MTVIHSLIVTIFKFPLNLLHFFFRCVSLRNECAITEFKWNNRGNQARRTRLKCIQFNCVGQLIHIHSKTASFSLEKIKSGEFNSIFSHFHIQFNSVGKLIIISLFKSTIKSSQTWFFKTNNQVNIIKNQL